MNLITVFTPVYNRGNLLNNLYYSLINQTYKNFEWIIVDDGSTDDTKSIVKSFIDDNKIKIKYFYKENGGKHTAINKGINEANGNLFFIVDSDDYLTCNSLELIDKYEKKINNKKIAGVCGLKGTLEHEIIGTTFEGETKDLYNYERKKYHITGDKAEAYYTNILKKYKFPEYENEKFLSEAVIWNQIALDGYKLKYFNEIIYICEYLEDGLTKNIFKNYKNSPKGFLEYIKQQIMINKSDFFEQIKLVSLYCNIMKDKYSKKEMSKQLNKSVCFINFSLFIRNIFGK